MSLFTTWSTARAVPAVRWGRVINDEHIAWQHARPPPYHHNPLKGSLFWPGAVLAQCNLNDIGSTYGVCSISSASPTPANHSGIVARRVFAQPIVPGFCVWFVRLWTPSEPGLSIELRLHQVIDFRRPKGLPRLFKMVTCWHGCAWERGIHVDYDEDGRVFDVVIKRT
jgi:hypothetical protein